MAPVSPAGIVKLRTALQSVPELYTDAAVPGAPVEVLPTVTLGFVHAGGIGGLGGGHGRGQQQLLLQQHCRFELFWLLE